MARSLTAKNLKQFPDAMRRKPMPTSRSLSCALFLSVFLSAESALGAITYNLNHSFPVTGGDAGSATLTVTGTITTDGTLGNIFSNSFTDWSNTFESDNLPAVTAIPSNSTWDSLNGLSFRATNTELFLRIPFGIQQRTDLLSSVGAQWNWGDVPLAGGVNNLRISLTDSSTTDIHFSGPFDNEFLLAVVPEPTSAFLLLAGLLGISGRWRRGLR